MKWDVEQCFCNNFCRGEHGLHICWSNEDFENYKGFNICATETGDYVDSIYKCAEIEYSSEERDSMKDHIESKHKETKTAKCTFRAFTSKSWRGLRKHFKKIHMKPYVD